jgi:lipopolysaccharide export system protein LptA
MLFAVITVCAGLAHAVENGKDADMIRIKADNLVAYNDANYAEFAGNVSATQGTTLITSDKLRIYYNAQTKALAATAASNAAPKNAASPNTGEESIKKVVASGNVVIHFEDRIAYTQQAEYDPKSKTIVLTGPDSKVTSGNNYIVGEKITLFAKDNKVLVERSKAKQVEAVFYSGQIEKTP